MKILFLDIDGVLNSFDNQFAMQFLWKLDPINKSRDKYGVLFDNRCVVWLNYIIKKTECKIVISSAWRMSGLISLQQMWEYRNLPGKIIDITPTIVNPKIILKYDDFELADRGFEIQEWLENNQVDNYCIVDDNSDMLPSQKFIRTMGNQGLNYNSAIKIVNILNK